MKKLKIAQIAPMWFPVPPEKYGGTERIISFITEGMIKKGHTVELFAPGNSKTKAKLTALSDKGIIEQGVAWTDYWWNVFNHAKAFERAEEFDIIHCHWHFMGSFFQRFTKTPVVHTLHNILKPEDFRWQILKEYQNDFNPVFISQSEKDDSPINFKNNYIVYNGIDIAPFKFNSTPQDHLVWIARICPSKGAKEAIEIAKQLGMKLLMAGQLQPQHEEYFEKEIKPELNDNIRYLGELSEKEIAELYGSAKAFLYPINWEEPFGLVMVEAMACGTPVIVFDRGSAREIVEDGKTGFVVKGIAGAVEAVKKIDQIKREDCRKRVEDNFTKEVMVEEYEKLYYKVIKNV